MAAGSEQISKKWIEGAKRECVKCGMKITNLAKQVGEVRTTFPGGVREIICMSCHLYRGRHGAYPGEPPRK